MVRTVEQWRTLLRGKFPRDAAKRILGEIYHYQHERAYQDDDIQQLANALAAGNWAVDDE
jgi:hypothetical protein